MHDLHLADKIHKLVLEKAKENNLKKIKEICIALGHIIEHGEDINAENLKFNLNLLNQNSMAQGAEIKIIKIEGKKNFWNLKSITGD